MKTNELKEIWEDLRDTRAYQKRLDPNHPLDFFVGVSSEGKNELILITNEEPANLKSSKQLMVEKNQRGTDARWATQIILETQEYSDIFSQFCLDLLDISKDCKNEHAGLIMVISRFLAWQRLFSTVNNRLSESIVKGLIGELSLALDVLSNSFSWEQIVNAWVGPEGADRDYVLDNTWYEVKAISTGKDFVTISSLNQLDATSDGFIAQYFVDKSTRIDGNSFSVSSLINRVRMNLADYPMALQLFDNKLIMLGLINEHEYDELFFTCSKPTIYLVNQSFPKLIPSNVPNQIINAQYNVSLSAIEQWKVGTDL